MRAFFCPLLPRHLRLPLQGRDGADADGVFFEQEAAGDGFVQGCGDGGFVAGLVDVERGHLRGVEEDGGAEQEAEAVAFLALAGEDGYRRLDPGGADAALDVAEVVLEERNAGVIYRQQVGGGRWGAEVSRARRAALRVQAMGPALTGRAQLRKPGMPLASATSRKRGSSPVSSRPIMNE